MAVPDRAASERGGMDEADQATVLRLIDAFVLDVGTRRAYAA